MSPQKPQTKGIAINKRANMLRRVGDSVAYESALVYEKGTKKFCRLDRAVEGFGKIVKVENNDPAIGDSDCLLVEDYGDTAWYLCTFHQTKLMSRTELARVKKFLNG